MELLWVLQTPRAVLMDNGDLRRVYVAQVCCNLQVELFLFMSGLSDLCCWHHAVGNTSKITKGFCLAA